MRSLVDGECRVSRIAAMKYKFASGICDELSLASTGVVALRLSLRNRANSVHELLRPLSASSGFSSNLKCIPLWQTRLCHGFRRLRSDVAGIARGTASRNRVARQEITRPRYRPLFSSTGSAVCTVRRRNVLFSYRYRAESRGHRAILSHDRVHRATFAVNLPLFHCGVRSPRVYPKKLLSAVPSVVLDLDRDAIIRERVRVCIHWAIIVAAMIESRRYICLTVWQRGGTDSFARISFRRRANDTARRNIRGFRRTL